MMDLPSALGARLFNVAQLLARGVEQAMAADGVFVAINNRVSQSVPHVHVHVVPRNYKDGLRGFFWPRTKYSDEAVAEQVRDKLASAIETLRQ
jgi:histidine triad (HIT) family protein